MFLCLLIQIKLHVQILFQCAFCRVPKCNRHWAILPDSFNCFLYWPCLLFKLQVIFFSGCCCLVAYFGCQTSQKGLQVE